MALDRRTFRLIAGWRRVKYKVRLTSLPCEFGTQEALHAQQSLMEDLRNHPELLHCGPARWQHLTIRHNGAAWEAEAYAEVEEDTEGR